MERKEDRLKPQLALDVRTNKREHSPPPPPGAKNGCYTKLSVMNSNVISPSFSCIKAGAWKFNGGNSSWLIVEETMCSNEGDKLLAEPR